MSSPLSGAVPPPLPPSVFIRSPTNAQTISSSPPNNEHRQLPHVSNDRSSFSSRIPPPLPPMNRPISAPSIAVDDPSPRTEPYAYNYPLSSHTPTHNGITDISPPISPMPPARPSRPQVEQLISLTKVSSPPLHPSASSITPPPLPQSLLPPPLPPSPVSVSDDEQQFHPPSTDRTPPPLPHPSTLLTPSHPYASLSGNFPAVPRNFPPTNNYTPLSGNFPPLSSSFPNRSSPLLSSDPPLPPFSVRSLTQTPPLISRGASLSRADYYTIPPSPLSKSAIQLGSGNYNRPTSSSQADMMERGLEQSASFGNIPTGASGHFLSFIHSQSTECTPSCTFTLIDEVGRGAFGVVWRAECKSTNPRKAVAIKILAVEKDDEGGQEVESKNLESAWKEITETCLLRHPHILRYSTAFVRNEQLWIIMPIMVATCRDAIELMNVNGIKDNAAVATILQDTLKGLEYLHRNGKIHKDIKAENLLFNAAGDVLVADFGVAADIHRYEDDDEGKRPSFAGTPAWMAPELMISSSATTPSSSSSPPSNGLEAAERALLSEIGASALHHQIKSDIWSVGILALELAYGQPPHVQCDPIEMRRRIIMDPPPTSDYFRDQSYAFSKEFASFVSACLVKNPRERPSATTLLNHRFIKGYAKRNKYIQEKILGDLIKRKREKMIAEQRERKELLRQQQKKQRMNQAQQRFNPQPAIFEVE